MPVKTISIEVKEGPDLGLKWEGEEATVGTARDNSLPLPSDETISRYHLQIKGEPSGVRVVDLGSTNGTFLHSSAAAAAAVARIESCIVPIGSILRLGKTSLHVGRGLPTTVELHDDDHLGPIHGETQVMRRLMSQIRRAAQSHVAVLLIGESGTGKELFARALHDASPRAKAGPFITFDCASVTPSLVASELFGHEKGSFTGANQMKKGAFEEADGGTLFLDEIGELPIELQANLLGALERRRFCRVGGRKEIAVDVRVVSATNRDLRTDVNAGAFRLDLYYRLAVVTLEVPSLRERREDIPLLIEHFAREEGWEGAALSELVPDVRLAELLVHRWPGNVRELRNYVQAIVAMGEADLFASGQPASASIGDHGNVVGSDDDGAILQQAFANLFGQPYNDARNTLLREFEYRYLDELMKRTEGNVAKGAREARMARSHLNDLLRRHRIR